METRDETTDFEQVSLSEPGRELAERITQKVPWKDRIEGYTYARGPGEMWESFCKLEELHNVLGALPNFRLDFKTLKLWVGDTLGDEELAEKIEEELNEDSTQRRRAVTGLLAIRLKQCKAVLEDENNQQDPTLSSSNLAAESHEATQG